MKKFTHTVAVLATAALSLASCTKVIFVDNVNDEDYANLTTSYGSLRDADNYNTTKVIDLGKDTVSAGVVFSIPRSATAEVNVQIFADTAYVDVYNKKHSTMFAAFPASQLSIANDGKAVVAVGKKTTENIALTFAPFADTVEATYGAPSSGWRIAMTSTNLPTTIVVSSTVSPLLTEEFRASENPSTLPPSSIIAAVKLRRVLVLGS